VKLCLSDSKTHTTIIIIIIIIHLFYKVDFKALEVAVQHVKNSLKDDTMSLVYFKVLFNLEID